MNRLAFLVICLVSVLTACSQSSPTTPSTQLPSEQDTPALFTEADLSLAKVISSSLTLVEGIDLENKLIGIEEPFVEEAEAELTTSAVLPNVDGFLAYARTNIDFGGNRWEIWINEQSADLKSRILTGTLEVDSVGVTGDGSVVVASIFNPATNSFDIYRLATSSSSLEQLTNSPEDETNVSTDVAGETIAWEGDNPSRNVRAPFICSYANGACSINMLNGGVSRTEPSLSGNGAYLVMVQLRSDGRYLIRKYDIAANTFSTVVGNASPLKDPSISDDGNIVMYQQDMTASSGRELVRFKNLTSNVIRTERSLAASAELTHPYITADGLFLTYAHKNNAGQDNPKTRNIDTNQTVNAQGGDFNYFATVWMLPAFDPCSVNTLTVTGDQTLTSQADVDALSTAKIIDGDLTIADSAPDLDLSPLGQLVEITGDFRLDNDNTNQTVIAGFDCLETIGLDFDLFTAFATVNALTTVGDFPKLTTVGQRFVIANNNALSNFGDFPQLTTVTGNLFFRNNDALTSIDTFPSLTTIEGIFEIQNNDALTTVSGFDVLSRSGIDSTVIIDNNPNFDCTNPAPAFTPLNLSDTSTGNLVNCPIVVTGDQTLTSQAQVNALVNVTKIEGSLIIAASSVDLDLSPLGNLTEITGNFRILDNNNTQTSIFGFASLETIGGDFRIRKMDDGTATIGDFPSLVSVASNFQIQDNANLASIGDFPQLTTVGGEFGISFNPNLTSYSSFPSLTAIGDDFNFVDNDSVTNLSGFDNINSLSGGTTDIRIIDNDALVSINGLSSLTNADLDRIAVNNNPLLDCTNPAPTFTPLNSATDTSTGNLVNCPIN